MLMVRLYLIGDKQKGDEKIHVNKRNVCMRMRAGA